MTLKSSQKLGTPADISLRPRLDGSSNQAPSAPRQKHNKTKLGSRRTLMERSPAPDLYGLWGTPAADNTRPRPNGISMKQAPPGQSLGPPPELSELWNSAAVDDFDYPSIIQSSTPIMASMVAMQTQYSSERDYPFSNTVLPKVEQTLKCAK